LVSDIVFKSTTSIPGLIRYTLPLNTEGILIKIRGEYAIRFSLNVLEVDKFVERYVKKYYFCFLVFTVKAIA
jgi:hypothetical protein